MLRDLGYEITKMVKENDNLKVENEMLKIKAAKYKAFFFW